MNEIAKSGFNMYNDSGIVRKEFVAPKRTKEENDKITDIVSNVLTYIKEMEQKWILGTADVDADWDTYLKTLDDMGMKTYTEVYNAAYAREKELKK